MIRVDSHHHFWDPSKRDYYWMAGDELAPIRRTIDPEDLRPLLGPANIDKTVLVQTIPDVDETREFLAIAAKTDFVAGVVGWVDLTDPAIASVLADLKAGPGGSYLVAIRHQVHDEEDPDWVARPDVVNGVRACGAAGLVYDLLTRERELDACIKCVVANPEMRFVVDHIAKPRIAEHALEPWAERMTQIAQHSNVWCKVSGMVTEADWHAWKPDDLAPYVNKVIELFGEDRLLFGSDWPVSLLAAEYTDVVSALETVVGDRSQTFKDKLFGANAIELYRLAI